MISKSVGFLVEAVDAVVKSFDLEEIGGEPWAGPDARYYLTLHNDDVHTKM